MCSQALCQCLYLPPEGHTQGAGYKAEGYVGEVWGVLGMPVGQLGDLLARPLQKFVGGPSNGVCKEVSRIRISLMHSKSCLLCSQPLPTLSCATYLSILEGVRKKWASLAVSCTAGETGHSLRHSLAALEEIPGLGGLFCH